VDGYPRLCQGLDYMTEQQKAPAVRKDGQGADPVGDLEPGAKGRTARIPSSGRRPARRMFVLGRYGVKKHFNCGEITGSQAEGAVDRLTDYARTGKRQIYAVLGEASEEVRQRPVGGRNSVVSVLDKFGTEPDSTDAYLHFAAHR